MTFSLTHTGTIPATRNQVSAPENSSDLVLVARIARGDQFAMRTLFARHQVVVFRFVLRLVRDEALAEDVLSEVFLDVWRQAGRFEGRSSVSTWLLAIARYKTLSACRRRRDVGLDEAIAEAIADSADTPDVALEKKQDGEALREALLRLSPDHSEVLDLVYYHEKSVAEAAEVLAIPEATVKTRMFYARKKLAQLMHAA
jgi:RNA polymerase sigma-70 factor, ECF subfamily